MDDDHPLAAHLPGFVRDLGEDLAAIRFADLEPGEQALSSFADGMAGVAFALWHTGRVTSNDDIGAAAAPLALDAIKNSFSPGAFASDRSDYEAAGLMFGQAGLDWVAALVGASRDPVAFAPPAKRWPEIYFGRAGHLIASLISRSHGESGANVASEAVLAELLGRADGGIPAYASLDFTGLAHGFGGLYYAVLLATRELDRDPPSWLAPSLFWLAELGAPCPSMMSDPDGGSLGGLCNGSPGLVQVFVMAHEVLGDSLFLESATRAADDILSSGPALPTMCCGAIGDAYALLAMSRISGEKRWRRAAYDRAAAGLGNGQLSLGMLHGDAAALCLAADLLADRTTIPFLDTR